MIRKIGFAVLFGLGLALSAQAADTPPATPEARAPLSDIIHVAAGQSVEINVPEEFKDVVVGNSDIADVVVQSRRKVFIVGRVSGQTNISLLDPAGRTIRRMQVDVAIDTSAVRDALRRILPGETALEVEAVNDSLYLTGSVKYDASVAMAKTLARRFVANDVNLVNMVRVSNDQQVLLHVKVAEVERTVLKELGVGTSTTKTIPLLGHWGTLSGATSSTADLINSSANTIFGTATLGLGSLVTNLNILESQGLIRTLVEPNLTAVSGETATMLAGGELPIPVSQVNGAISVEFKPYGVLLGFTPTVLDPGRLSMKLSTEVSSIDTANATAISQTISVPAFKVRRAGSTIELPSGGSIMIAGLLQNDITSNISGLPGAMDLPVLGQLFRSDSFQRNETELVVIVTAYVVQATDRQASLATPSDGFAPSSDIKRFLLGRLQDTYTTTSKAPAAEPPQLQGPYGYIVQ